MEWKGRRQSDHVDDRRESSGGGRRGLPSMGMMMMLWPLIKPMLKSKFGLMVLGVGALAYFSGFNPLSLIGMSGGSHSSSLSKAEEEKEAAFVKTVLADIEDVWTQELPRQLGMKYKKPTMVLYRGSTRSGCGYASAQMGPFYCPVDQKVYLDLGFFDDLARRHNASGDFAQAYVIAHEIGHHIQNMQGRLDQIQGMKRQVSREAQANHLQVLVELQADCYAGVWAHFAQTRLHVLEQGDIQEALNAASKIGDDTLQRQATGYVMPDGFTHGTSKQRMAWFKHGFLKGSLQACNTFKN